MASLALFAVKKLLELDRKRQAAVRHLIVRKSVKNLFRTAKAAKSAKGSCGSETVDEAPQAVLDSRDIPIDQEPDLSA